jgi:hypothetical protein
MNIRFETITFWTGQSEDYVIIENENGSFVSMTKAHWDELQAKQEETLGGN